MVLVPGPVTVAASEEHIVSVIQEFFFDRSPRINTPVLFTKLFLLTGRLPL